MKSVAIKSGVLVALWALLVGLSKVFLPVMTNSVALTQLQDSPQSFTNLAGYTVVIQVLVAILIIVSIAIYIPDIKKLLNQKEI